MMLCCGWTAVDHEVSSSQWDQHALSSCYQYLSMYCTDTNMVVCMLIIMTLGYSRKCGTKQCVPCSLTVTFWTTQHYQLVVHYTTTCSHTLTMDQLMETHHIRILPVWVCSTLDCGASHLQTTRKTSIVQLPILCE